MNSGPIYEKTFSFAVRIVKLSNHLREERREYVLSKQILRSGTASGALVREAKEAESRKDFIHKMNVALKEARETEYWIELLFATDYLSQSAYRSLIENCVEIIKILTAIIKTSKNK